MKLSHYIATATILVASAVPVLAIQQADEHKDHHPAQTTVAPKPAAAIANSVKPVNSGDQIADMDSQMKRMREMHEKMMNAKTPKERKALMAEHMKVMQDGMNKMSEMSSQGMGGMKMKVGMPENAKDDMKDGMSEHHKMMEKRMEMMHHMMQMMMDRMSDTSTK